MIDYEKLRPGGKVWWGTLYFTRSSRISSRSNEFKEYKIADVGSACICLKSLNSSRQIRLYVTKTTYGKSMNQSLYESLEDAKEDWNSLVYSEIDRVTGRFDSIRDSIKQRISNESKP